MNTHKYIMIIALTYGVSACAMEFDPLNAPKIGNKAFSLIAPYTQFVHKNPPNIGVYGKGYPMLTRIGRIQLSPQMITNWLPPQLARALPAHIPDLTFDVEIDRAAPQTYNMVFHPWVATWAKTKENKGFPNIKVPMGMFENNGVWFTGGDGIPFGRLAEQKVHIHPDGEAIAYSPNNARFTVSPNRDLSTFWSAAVSHDKQHGIVAFHILVNSDKAQQVIEGALRSANTLGEFLQELKRGAATFTNDVDRQALRQAVQTIEYIIGVQKAVAITPEPQVDVQEPLRELARSLTHLANALRI